MRVTFWLRYHTEYGQLLRLTGDRDLFGDGPGLAMNYLNGSFWQATLATTPEALRKAAPGYSYALREPDASVVEDWGTDRRLDLGPPQAEELLIIDSWNPPGQNENVYYTKPFRQILLPPDPVERRGAAPPRPTHLFRVKAPLLPKGQTLCLLGNSPALGQWATADPVLLSRPAGEDYFSVALDLGADPLPLAYKYGAYDLAAGTFLRFEEGPNRTLPDTGPAGRFSILNDGFAALPCPPWRGAGVAVPVFSLRSRSSFGIGEFSDIKLLADWCRQTGLKMIQLLPINDTTATYGWMDSYPYSAISAFALNPVFLDLARVATHQTSRQKLAELQPAREHLNRQAAADYPAVAKAKLQFLREIFPSEKAKTLESRGYRSFIERHRHWLEPYAAFCHLRDRFGTADFTRWPRCRSYRPEEVAELAPPDSPAAEEIDFHRFLQYRLHQQLLDAAQYAHRQGVVLKGDIPIGVYRHGVDAWEQPELFHAEMQAGAPPDAFAAKGQNWKFPTYDWARIKETGFQWWKRRLDQMGDCFDAFRLDHVLGFFRIWSIPLEQVEGILGHFVPCCAVQPEEFTQLGIHFDRDRFLRPYITSAVLTELFGAEEMVAKARFLEGTGPGRYRLKPQFETQRGVEAFFARQKPSAQDAALKRGLFDLISNVILLEAPDQGPGCHFRFGIEGTASFRDLDEHTRTRLWELYIDYFYHRQEAGWRQEGLEKLALLKRATAMLVCGEDLGMVPACVPGVMKQLGLLSLEVQRMPKRLGQDFSRPSDAPCLSVVTPSTHDMSTLRGWWREDRNVTQRFYNHELGRPGQAPQECEPWVSQAIVSQHLARQCGNWPGSR